MHIPHCLCAPEGATLDGITRIFSHPQALLQCRRFLNGRFEQTGTSTTSDAVREVADAGERGVGRDRVARRRAPLRPR